MKYNPTQVGSVIVFKPGTTKEQAKEALEKIKHLLDHAPRVNTFDPDWGEPVWYIP